jgi:hypothetical protein
MHGIQDRILKIVDILAVVLAVWRLNGLALTPEVQVW